MFGYKSCEIWKKYLFSSWKWYLEIGAVFRHKHKLELFLNFCEHLEWKLWKQALWSFLNFRNFKLDSGKLIVTIVCPNSFPEFWKLSMVKWTPDIPKCFTLFHFYTTFRTCTNLKALNYSYEFNIYTSQINISNSMFIPPKDVV